jgi:plasmid stabilization system protein ParE
VSKGYRLRYLPLFEDDLNSTVSYIANRLKNPKAAADLVDAVETAILKRLPNPEAFRPYESTRQHQQPYYAIYVKNFIVFYVVIDDIMEVRRLLYKKRNIKNMLE